LCILVILILIILILVILILVILILVILILVLLILILIIQVKHVFWLHKRKHILESRKKIHKRILLLLLTTLIYVRIINSIIEPINRLIRYMSVNCIVVAV